jgi:uncharacterized protein (TIGR03086 family)
MEPIEQLEHIVPTLNALVERIAPAQLNDRTPCDNFTVHDVLDHMMVLGGTFAYWFRGEEAPEITAPPVYGRVPTAEFKSAMNDLLAATRSPGAMDRVITAPVGEMPGSAFARFVAFDGTVHGWDLATAAGLTFELPSEVVDAVDGFARGALSDEMRDGDTFKHATDAPESATRLERLVAFSGRSL